MSSVHHRIIYYYQTFSTLRPILNTPDCCGVTHIHLSAFHFGKNPDNSPYIHLNNYPPENEKFNSVWKELEEAQQKGIKIVMMLGGAGGAFDVLFSSYEIYSIILLQTLRQYSCIQGIDLDIEESVQLTDVQKLIRMIRTEMGPDFLITMAPVQSSLESDTPGMGGFVYKDLLNSPEGKEIAYFNGQFYGSFTEESYDNCIKNGYKAEKVVMGMIYSENMSNALYNIVACNQMYPKFGGVFCWEYIYAPPQSPEHPEQWAKLMQSIFNPPHKKVSWAQWFVNLLHYINPYYWISK